MKKLLLLVGAMALFTASVLAQGIVANFSCEEATVAYYTQGWDSQDEFDTWSYTSTSSSTWHLSATGTVPFSTVDKDSKSSLALQYGGNQNETATSPEITIRPNSTLEFYCYASGIYLVYGAWKLYAIDGETSTLLLDQFMWAQDNAYEGPRWVKYSLDLSSYANKTVRFSFVYQGSYGEDEALDGFRIVQVDDNATSITINEGEQVHFKDLSTGNVSSREWTFYGGEPLTSSEPNPVVTYNQAGSYAVKLQVAGEGGTDSQVKLVEGYVTVVGQTPEAKIGMPDEAYLSPFCAAFVPVDVPVQFCDLSTGRPTSWAWEFSGTDPLTSTDQNPVVTYTAPGTYGLKLTATNDLGSDEDVLLNAVQAGGQQYIWNIAPEENSDLSTIEMGWYGNYGGTNWLGLAEFGEHFQEPLAAAQIERVVAYFAKTTCSTTDADIIVKIQSADEQGMPGEVLAQSSLKASELQYDTNEVVETVWNFDNPVPVDGEFFVTISGFPNNDGDDIALLLYRRGAGEKSTAYQFVLDEDDTGWNYLDTGKWYKNDDDPISLAICPVLNYDVGSSVAVPTMLRDSSDLIVAHHDHIAIGGNVDAVSVYDLNGRCVMRIAQPQSAITLGGLPSGAYVVRASRGSLSQTIKVIK